MQCNDKAGRTWSRLAMALLVGDEMHMRLPHVAAQQGR
jgi:hypothetical protein